MNGTVTTPEKKGKEKKNRTGPTCQPLPLPPLCFLPRAAARVAAAGHPREPRHVPAIVESRAASSLSPRPSPYPRRARSRSPPQTLAPPPLPPPPPSFVAAVNRRRR
jgi:hypothetical protein